MRIIERLKRFFEPKEEKPDELRRQEKIERLRAEERELERFRRSLSQRVPRASRPVPRRQPASQTYTQKKVRGLPPRAAFSKRMWRTQVSKEELDEL